MTDSVFEPVRRVADLNLTDSEWGMALGGWDRTRRWSLRGRSPSPVVVQQIMLEPSLVQERLVAESGQTVGIVEVTHHSSRDSYAQLALLVDPAYAEEVSSQLAIFLRDIWEDNPELRKLVIWSFADEIEVPGYLPRATQVGRLTNHERRSESVFVDQLVHEVWPEDVA